SPSHSRSMMRRALSRDCHGEKEKFGVSRRLSAELVAHPAHREDVLGPVGVAFDLLAEPIHEVVDRPGGAVVIESPHVPKDRLARKHFAPASDQELEELELLRRQLDALSPAAHRPAIEIDDDISERVRLLLILAKPPKDALHTREELPDAEGLRHVVITPEVEPLDLVALRRLRGEEDHRRADVVSAQRLAHLEAVDLREHDVEDDQVRPTVDR